jgi:UDP-glucuronate decarboxylase
VKGLLFSYYYFSKNMTQNVIFDKKNVLVIGGAGFLGSHLCDALIKNSKVICIDNFTTGTEKNIDHLLAYPDFEFIRHDMCEPLVLEELPELQKFKIEFQGIQEIYNLACPMSPMNFDENIVSVALANSFAVKNSLDLALKYKAKFLHTSSSVVYGENKQENKVDESYIGKLDNLSARAAYDEGKRFAETLVDAYQRKYNLDTKIVRLFRVYGPRMVLNDGQMIPDFVVNALNDQDLEVYGDKEFSSSFCYISDAIDALMKAMDTDFSDTINIGSDILVNLTDLAYKIINKLNSKSKVVYKDELLFMKPLAVPSIKKAKEILNWMPIMSLEKGLENTVYDLEAHKGLKGINSIL